jgi:tetratricopeptide (TPR) repeat protein
MKMKLTAALLALTCIQVAAFAQAKQPQPKTKQEVEALMAIQNATDINARLAAIDNVLNKFADTEFKPALLTMAAMLYQQKGDQEKMVVYAERALQADPKDYQAMVLLGQNLAAHTREFDLDKEDKLTRADKYANDALKTLQTAEKPRPDLTDEQWTEAKKNLEGQAHEILGTSAMVRKKYDAAVTEYKAAADAEAPNTEPATLVRLAAAENQAGKPDDALATIDKVMATPNLDARIRSVAQAEKARAAQIKSGGSKPATPPPASTTTPQTEPIKKP